MRRRADAGRCVVQLAGLGLGGGDQIGGGLVALGGAATSTLGEMPTALTAVKSFERVVGQRLVRHIGGAERRRMEQDGVAVRRGARRLADADGAAGAGLAFDHDRPGRAAAELFEHDARGDVVGVAGGERNDRRDIARRLVLRAGRRREDDSSDQCGQSRLHSSTPGLVVVVSPTGVWHGGQRNVTRRPATCRAAWWRWAARERAPPRCAQADRGPPPMVCVRPR